jgi:hypothetical protein
MSETIIVRQSRWPAVLAGFILGVLVAVGTAGGLYYQFVWSRPSVEGEVGPGLIPRPDFTARVDGKTEDEVVAAVGRPDETSEDPASRTKFWHFKRRTRDPVSGVTDADVQVVIMDGRVTAVNY